MSKPAVSCARKRVRLSPAVRMEQILDAALAEFSMHGFGAARMECIARRVGMSKAGLYAHFSGKEAIFETLLQKILAPDFPTEIWLRRDGQSLEDVVDAYVDDLYLSMDDARAQAVLRLVISESGRVPHLIRKWCRELRLHVDGQQQIISECVEEGSLRASPLTENFALAFSPALYCAVWRLIFIEDEQSDGPMLATFRQAHRQLLLDILRPRAEAKPAP